MAGVSMAQPDASWELVWQSRQYVLPPFDIVHLSCITPNLETLKHDIIRQARQSKTNVGQRDEFRTIESNSVKDEGKWA